MIPSITNHRDNGIVYLNIGDVTFLHNMGKAWTVLGSCVSVLLYSKQQRFSALCHAQFPERSENNLRCYEQCPDSCFRGRKCLYETKYVDKVIPVMIKTFARQGIQKEAINAIIIGGASVIELFNKPDHIGYKNVEMAKTILNYENIGIVKEDIGGNKSRQVILDNETGHVFVNRQPICKIW